MRYFLKKAATFYVLAIFCSGISYAGQTQSKVILSIRDIEAYYDNGTIAPEYQAKCKIAYNYLVGKKIVVQYSINPTTWVETANADIQQQSVVLHPAGILGKFVFISDGVPKKLTNLHQVIFEINAKIQNASSAASLMFSAPFAEGVNCIVNAEYFSGS